MQPSENKPAPEALADTRRQLDETLASAVARAAGSAARSAHLLQGLAHIDPEAAASWLTGSEDQARSLLDEKELAEAVARTIAELVSRPPADPETRRTAPTALATRYSDLLTADALVLALGEVPDAGRSSPPLRDLMAQVLKREPRHPALLNLAAGGAVAAGDWSQADDLLDRLARVDGTQSTVRHVWRARAGHPAEAGATIRVALLSTFTVDPLVPYLDLECRALGLRLEPYVAPFNSWMQEILSDSSGLRRFAPQVVFLSLALDDLAPALAGDLSPSELEASGELALERVLGAARQLSSWSDSTLIVHSFHSVHPDPGGVAMWRNPGSRSEWLAGLNRQLADGLRELARTYMLDVQDVLLRRSGGPFDNPKMRHLAAMRWCEQPLAELARAYARFIAPAAGLTRKCVVVDLDNTLWGGIVGEDAIHGIKLGNTSPGSEYQEFQRYLRTLSQRGFLLAINSKNNPDDALEAIRKHQGMILREGDFSAIRINWLPKPENMVSIATELGIGIDSLVFIDDEPKERALMRQSLPQVLTPELPHDPSRFRQTIEAVPELQKLVLTEEDRARTELYRAKRERQVARQKVGSLDEYLRSLDIRVRIEPASEATLPRVHQLFERTNQFNLTSRRHDAARLAALARDPDWLLYTMQVSDRFGDHGLVGTALVHRERSRWVIDSFLLSCRVIGYGVESALLATISDEARAAGASSLVGELIETPKNAPARDLYARHLFVKEEASGDGPERWHRDLSPGAIRCPDWIQATIATEGAGT